MTPVTRIGLANVDSTNVLSAGASIRIPGAAATWVTSVVALEVPAVAVIVVVAPGDKATDATWNVPLVSLKARVVADWPPTEIVDGSRFAYVPDTSMDDDPVCVPLSGEVMAS